MDNTATLSRAIIPDPVAGVDYQEVQKAHPVKNITVTTEFIARMCHEVTRIWNDIIGDPPLQPWNEAPEWQRNSVITGVNFHLTNTATTPRDSHESWLKTRHEEGWKFGPVKDAEKKEHPCFCSYDALPWYQQAKDHLFVFVVKALAPLMVIPGHTRPLTDGERIAGITFNPSKNWKIDFVKNLYAELYDYITRFAKEHESAPNTDDSFARKEIGRSAAESNTCLQTSKMFAVEALTR